MTITRTDVGSKTVFQLAGAFDADGAEQFRKELKRLHNRVGELVCDMTSVQYVTSAGLRALLAAQKKMSQKGSLRLINVGGSVWNTLELRGFEDILYIDRADEGD